MSQTGFATLILIVVLVIIVAGGVGYWALTKQTTSVPVAENPTAVQNDSASGNQISIPVPSSNTVQPSKTPVSKPGWTTTINQPLGIRFEHPTNATVSSVEQRKTTDGTTINELTVTPTGMDPTRVHFFSTKASFDQAKNIQIYGFTNIKNSEFGNAAIDGRAGTRRIDYNLNNDCTNELTVVEKSGVVYGFHIVQCPSHPEGYDQLRRDIANSIELL